MEVKDLIGKNINVKLGAKGGSAFVFCGNMRSIDICDVDESIRNAYQITLTKAKQTIQCLSNKPKTYPAYEAEMARKLDKALAQYKHDPRKIAEAYEQYTPSKLGYHKWSADITRRLEYAKTVRRRTNQRLNNYTSVADREIKESYPSIDEANTLIILYDGKEHGTVWSTSEYKVQNNGQQME